MCIAEFWSLETEKLCADFKLRYQYSWSVGYDVIWLCGQVADYDFAYGYLCCMMGCWFDCCDGCYVVNVLVWDIVVLRWK